MLCFGAHAAQVGGEGGANSREVHSDWTDVGIFVKKVSVMNSEPKPGNLFIRNYLHS